MTLTDWNLNIDPTDEDSWTFGTLPSNATFSINYMMKTVQQMVQPKHQVQLKTMQSSLTLQPQGISLQLVF
jgi:hypothetical protein